MDETLNKLIDKSGSNKVKKYDIYYNDIRHFNV